MIAAHSTDQEEWRLGGGGASKSPLGWALPQHHQDTGGGDRERGGGREAAEGVWGGKATGCHPGISLPASPVT